MPTNATQTVACDVKDLSLAESGSAALNGLSNRCPFCRPSANSSSRRSRWQDIRVAACLHVTTETANLMIALRDGGANIALCASNPLSTQDDVAVQPGPRLQHPRLRHQGRVNDVYYSHIMAALDHTPQITMDDGADLVTMLHTKRQELLANVIGGTEETTTGVIRLRAMAKEKVLRYPIVAINDALTKHLFDNRYGTGQSTIDGIIRATNMSAGRHEPRGRRLRLVRTRRRHARPRHGRQRHRHRNRSHQGHRSHHGRLPGHVHGRSRCHRRRFRHLTGNKSVITRDHFEKMKNGAIVCNSGHFNVEIDLEVLASMASSRRPAREFVEEFSMRDGRKVYVLGRRPPDQSGRRRRTSGFGDGYELRQPGAFRRIHGQEPCQPGEARFTPCLKSSTRQVAKMKLEAMGCQDRPPHAGTGRIPGRLDRRDLR